MKMTQNNAVGILHRVV